MKTRKILSLALACLLIFALLAACQTSNSPAASPSTGGSPSAAVTTPTTPVSPSPDAQVQLRKDAGLDDNNKFTTKKTITVEIYDRANTGGSKPEDNYYTNYIKAGMLADHNVEVVYKPGPRWTETQEINNLLAANDAPDVCVTYSYPTIQEYAGMDAVLDLAPYVDDYAFIAPDLWSFLGDTNINWDRDTKTGELWAIEARLTNVSRISTFVREDWLKKLNIKAPTTMTEFETMLKSFKDNASTLLGADASKMVPFSISYDVGWRADHIAAAYIPDNITDKDIYVYGFDDRRLLFPGYKEGIRKLNQWYNEGLVWKDFALYGAGDTTEDDMMKAGYVGAFIHNWDYPYRSGETGVHGSMQKLLGADAAYIAVEPFKNDAGVYRKFIPGPIDRKVFFPATNKEPIASLLYLNWITAAKNLEYLQIGDAGVTHEPQADGSVKTIAATGDKIMNSPNNIDYTITCNGLFFQGNPEKTVKSIAMGYAGVDKRFIETAYQITTHDGRFGFNAKCGAIAAESGMAEPLKAKRDTFLDQAVAASVAQFDSVYDNGMNDYLASGGTAIINERKAAWEAMYGTKTTKPE